jgi:hypothetical protein
MSLHNAIAPKAQPKSIHFKPRAPFNFDDPGWLGLVYTIDPRFHPPSPKICITLNPVFAANWRRTRPHVPVMVFKDQDRFLNAAKTLEAAAAHVERLMAPPCQNHGGAQ